MVRTLVHTLFLGTLRAFALRVGLRQQGRRRMAVVHGTAEAVPSRAACEDREMNEMGKREPKLQWLRRAPEGIAARQVGAPRLGVLSGTFNPRDAARGGR
jgi:hypothetical protein